MEQSIDTATKAVNQSIEDVKTSTLHLANQSLEHISILAEHPVIVATLPIVSSSIGSAVGEMIAGKDGKNAFAQSIGSSLGRVAGEQLTQSLKNKMGTKTVIKEEVLIKEDVSPSKRRRRNEVY